MAKKMTVFVCLFVFFYSNASCQEYENETWEGMFLNDFRTMVDFSLEKSLYVGGTIKMFAGDKLIQDDILANVSCEQLLIRFTIPAKETSFKGKFNEDNTKLTGEFVFPDGTIHKIQLQRKKISHSLLMSLNL